MRRTAWVVAGLCFAAASALACQPRATKVGGGDDLPEDQWSRGVFLYGQSCAGCHGDNGEGDEATPAIAGDGALSSTAPEGSDRQATFDDAADLFGYVKSDMPPLAPGSLSDDEYWAIIHYVLKQAQIDPGVEVVGPDNAASIKLR